MLKRVQKQKTTNTKGFTIVELLIVIVVIAILAAITTAVFGSMQQRATKSALDSALSGTAKRLQVDKVTRGSFATALSDIQNSTDSNQGGIDYQYTSDGSTYCITATLRNIARYICSADSTIVDGAWSGHTAPITGPITDPVVYTQTGSFNYTTNGSNGIDFPIAVNYNLQPTDYVFILFNTHYYSGISIKNGSTSIPRIYSMNMGSSGYQWHQAFGVSGLSGNSTLAANVCWTVQCTYSGAGVNGAYIVYVIRGLGATPTVTATNTSPYGTQPGANVRVAPTAQTVPAGNVAISSYIYYGSTLPSEGDSSAPSLTWTSDSNSASAAQQGTSIASRHTFTTASTSVQYQNTMPTSGPSYHGMVVFTIKK